MREARSGGVVKTKHHSYLVEYWVLHNGIFGIRRSGEFQEASKFMPTCQLSPKLLSCDSGVTKMLWYNISAMNYVNRSIDATK